MKRLGFRLAALALFVAIPLGAGCSKKYPKRPAEASDPPNVACESSHVCKTWGWCQDRDGECIAGTNEHCRASEACKKGGLCSVSGTKCVAKDGDCDNSEWCEKNKLCKAREGVCK